MTDTPHEKRQALLNEARALRLVLALLQGYENPSGSMHSWQIVADEIASQADLEEIAIVLATKFAERIADSGSEQRQAAMRELDQEVTRLLDLAERHKD
ncbi:hypothetical protein [Mycobacterium sp. SP-6446]|uniref:hypothetical protein n=1 Tax=Mycobacterium sp. SP-6446 TaxID=1834162 RepID=UPI00096CF27A|nr:hypothetical protein [Mycobacterium sp. SP-6446]OMC14954.1 hypothetical protein A5736_20445 [Mycobacterium sp. SP-6446]